MPNIARKRERKRVKKLRRIEKARKARNLLHNSRVKLSEGMDAPMSEWGPQMTLLYHEIPEEIRE
jgi:hypothetical protein